MKRTIFFLLITVLAGTFLFYDCKKKEYARLNPLDPLYSGTTEETNGGTTPLPPTPHTGTLTFDKSQYVTTNDVAKITLTDADLTDNSQIINVSSPADPSGINFTLIKSSTAGVYTNTLLFSTNVSVSNVKILIKESQTVTATYNDASPAGARTATAIWSMSSSPAVLLIYDGLLNASVKGVINNQGLDIMHNSENGGSYSLATNKNNDYMQYDAAPGHGGWAFIGIYVQPAGLPVGSRDYIDLSDYTKITYTVWSTNTLSSVVQVGLKDRSDPDNGSESKYTIPTIDTTKRSYTNLLSSFATLNKTVVYMPIEFVVGAQNLRFFFDDVKFLK